MALQHADAVGDRGQREAGRNDEPELRPLRRPGLEDADGVADADVLPHRVVTGDERPGTGDSDVDLERLRRADDALVLEQVPDGGVARTARDVDAHTLARVPQRVQLVEEPSAGAEDQDDGQEHDPQRDERAPATTAVVPPLGGGRRGAAGAVTRRRVAVTDGLTPELVVLLHHARFQRLGLRRRRRCCRPGETALGTASRRRRAA